MTFNSLWPDFDHIDKCPVCGDPIEAMTNTIDIDPPTPGDATVCVMCTSVNVVGNDGYIRLPTPAEAMTFAQDPNIQSIIAGMRVLGPPKRR